MHSTPQLVLNFHLILKIFAVIHFRLESTLWSLILHIFLTSCPINFSNFNPCSSLILNSFITKVEISLHLYVMMFFQSKFCCSGFSPSVHPATLSSTRPQCLHIRAIHFNPNLSALNPNQPVPPPLLLGLEPPSVCEPALTLSSH